MTKDKFSSIIEGSIDRREFWLRIRQGLLIMLGAIEDLLGMERTKPPKHKQ